MAKKRKPKESEYIHIMEITEAQCPYCQYVCVFRGNVRNRVMMCQAFKCEKMFYVGFK